MKKIIAITLMLIFLGCNSKNESKNTVPVKKETKVEKNTPGGKTTTNGKAAFKQRGYNSIKLPPINVTYTGYNTEHFEFKSDEDDKTDTNGDGYVIFGKQDGKKFRLIILDFNSGKTYDSGNKINLSKQEEFFLGSGLLDETKEGGMFNISFWVVF